MFKKMCRNPTRTAISIVLIALGVFLVLSDKYFTWPPVLAHAANNDIFGLSFVATGSLMMWWILSKTKRVRLDHLLLTIASFQMAVLTIYQFLHFVFVGASMPWISNAAITAIIMIAARHADSV